MKKKKCSFCNENMKYVERGQYYKCLTCGSVRRKPVKTKFFREINNKTIGW